MADEKKPKKEKKEVVDEVEKAPRETVSAEAYEALKAQARKEILEEIGSGQLQINKKVFKSGAISAITPVFASLAAVKRGTLSANEQELPEGENDLVELNLDETVYVNGKELFGKVIVKTHEARGLIHMVQEKKRANLESTIGRNFLAKKLASGKLEIKEVQDLDKEIK